MLIEARVVANENSFHSADAGGARLAAIDPADLHNCRSVVHPLLFCPPVPAGHKCLLVRRSSGGVREILLTSRTVSSHPTVNLASIRRVAAQLGANEVHVLPREDGVLACFG